MPFDIALTEQMLSGSYRQTFVWKVNLKFCRQSRQTKNCIGLCFCLDSLQPSIPTLFLLS